MAHGFLTPQAVSGDRFWQNAKWLKDQLDKLLKEKKKEPQEKGGGLATTQKGGIVDENLKAVRITDVTASKAQRNAPPAARMLKQSAVAGALKPGVDSIVKKEQLALPPGGPRLPGGASPAKGGTFTNIPGVSAAPKKLDSEAFFKAAQTGVHPETGKYLSSEERKEYLKKSKAKMDAPASVAAGGASGIGSSSTVTKGDEEIVGSIEKLTKVTTSLVDVVKKQTSTQKQTADKAAAKAETIANRAKASETEKALEQGTDNSDFMTPVGGIGAPKSPSSGVGSGGGGLGLGTALGAAGKVIGKAAPGIGARGAARVLPRAGAAIAGKTGAKFGAKALTKIGGKTAARMIPGAQTAIGLGLAGEALSRGDILGAALSAGSAIPGPIGWGFLAADVARDLTGGGEGKGMAGGGLVTGGKKSVVDDVKINADEGEVVMSNAAGNAWGRSTLMAMNAMGGGTNKPSGGGKKYAEGGLVGGDKAKSKQMFKLFGEGMIDAQKQNSRDFSKIQSQGLKQYYENEGGFKKMGEGLAGVWSKIKGFMGGLFTSLTGGSAGATELSDPANYLGAAAGGKDLMTLATVAALESGSSQGQADVAQSVYNRLADKTYGSSISDILTKQGQYQVAFKDPTATSGAGTQVADEFKNIKTEDDAVKAMMYYYNKRGMRITAEQARQKLRGSLAAIQNQDLQKKAAQHVGGRTEFLARGQGGRGSVSRGGASDNDFFAAYGSGNQMRRGAAAAPTGLFDNASLPSAGTSSIAAAAQQLKGMNTASGPGGGNVSCVYAVNKVFQTAGQKPPWGGAQSTDAVINSCRRSGWQEVGFGAAQPGDVWVYDANDGKRGHVGIMMPNGKVLSNSSSKAKFNWEATKSELLSAYPTPGMTPAGGTFFRPPGGAASPSSIAAAKPRKPARSAGAPPPKATPSRSATGQEVAQASAFYASSMRAGSGGGNNTTIINNNSGGSGQRSTNPAAPSTSSNGMGLSALALRLQQ